MVLGTSANIYLNFTCPSLLVETMCVSPVKGKNLAWKMLALCPELYESAFLLRCQSHTMTSRSSEPEANLAVSKSVW